MDLSLGLSGEAAIKKKKKDTTMIQDIFIILETSQAITKIAQLEYPVT